MVPHFYVDDAVKEVPAANLRKTEPPHPVQVMFEFQTKGAPNAKATEVLKARVLAQIKDSSVFADVSEAPVADGALLSIQINNVSLTDDVARKGFGTGLTFGLVGTSVDDGYICTLTYHADAQAPALVSQARHVLHTTIGNTSAPLNGTPVASAREAAELLTRQVLSQALNDLTHKTDFR
ncbi:MAG: hypothetical protein JO224_01585 [Pelomonas sp.]|nr:hypothetical protein [Roseateles sp.]